MTELAIRQNNTIEVSAPRRLVEWAHEASAAHDLAVTLCGTAFCPDVFRGKAGEATAAILAGSEVGLSPMAALNAYDVIQGRPAPKAITLRALVQSAGHDIVLVSATADRVVMKGRRKGSAEWQTSDWSMKRARDAKLTSKSNWQTQPQNMLTARATSEISRLVGADVILGIPYSSEELYDQIPEPTTTASRTTERKTTAKRAALVAEEPDFEPSGMDEFAKPEQPAETGEAITAPQSKMLHALLNKNDLGDRDAGLAYIGGVIGREIGSSKDLTKAEASTCIDRLSTLEADSNEPTDAVLDEIAAGK
jgi:hypothetical protein